MKKLILAIMLIALSGCNKVGSGGTVSQMFGNWAEVRLPEGCKAKQIAGEEGTGVIVLCEDGRIFH